MYSNAAGWLASFYSEKMGQPNIGTPKKVDRRFNINPNKLPSRIANIIALF